MARKISGKTLRPRHHEPVDVEALQAELRAKRALPVVSNVFSGKLPQLKGLRPSPVESAAQLFASKLKGARSLLYKPSADGSRYTFLTPRDKTCELRMLRAVKAIQARHPREELRVSVHNLPGKGSRHMVTIEACKKQPLEKTEFA